MAERTRSIDLFVFVPLGLAVLAYVFAEPAEAIPPLALAACIAGRIVQYLTGWEPGRLLVSIAVAVAILYVILDLFIAPLDVTLFADFMMILGAIKAFERRTPRDDGQLLVVSIFVALSAAVSSNRLGTGVVLVLYVFALMLAVMRLNLDAAMWPRPVRRRRGLGPLLTGCIVGTTAVGAVAFVLLPRTDTRFAGGGLSPATQRVSGFTESLSLGTGGLISQDPREVMRVTRLGSNDQEIPIEQGEALYLRGAVLSAYERERTSGRWRQASVESDDVRRESIYSGSQFPMRGAPQWASYRIQQFAGASGTGTIFTLWRPVGMHFDDARGQLSVIRATGVMRFDEQQTDTIVYRVRQGEDQASVRGSRRGLPPLPSGSDSIRALAADVLQDAGINPDRRQRPVADDAPAIEALAQWLQSAKGYTLDIQPAPPGADPTEWFLTQASEGHCEYFASALALLCRDVGINSRVAMGYLAYQESTDGVLRVRRSDAHAWVEAEVSPGEWQTFDATPAASGEQFGQPVDPITRWLSSLESVWLASFVSYDARAQSRISGTLDRVVDWRQFGTDSDASVNGQGDRRWLPILGGLTLAASSILALLVLRRRRRSVSSAGAYSIPSEAADARDRLHQSWQEAGIPRPAGATLVGHARLASPDSIEEAERIERVAFRSG